MNTAVCFLCLYVLQMDAQRGIGKQTDVMQEAPGRSAVNRQKMEKIFFFFNYLNLNLNHAVINLELDFFKSTFNIFN